MSTHSTACGLIVGAAALARFIHSSDDERFQRNQIAARRSTILAWIEEQEGRP